MSDAPRNPDLRILGTLARLMARFGKRRLPITQHELLREMRADGRRMARRTLNRQLLALARDGIVRRRSYRPRWIAGQVRQRATAYSIGLRGQQWISLWAKSGAVPAARPSGVPFMAHIRSTLKLYGVRGTQRAKISRDNSARKQPGRGPRSRGGR